MYLHLSNEKEDSVNEGWMMVWMLNVPERVRTFMWLLKHDRLLTNLSKSRKGMGSAMCNLCGSSCKTTMHALRDCASARKMWGN